MKPKKEPPPLRSWEETVKAQEKLIPWLSAYETEVFRLLKGCTRQPTRGQHLPAGHMRFHQGIKPRKAAKRYVSETVWRTSCTKKKKK